jgi:hypothetical protein
MPKPLRVAIILLLAVALGYLFYASTHTSHYRVQVCVTFAGRTACSEVAGSTLAEAERAGHDTACAKIVSGVTETVGCERATATVRQEK